MVFLINETGLDIAVWIAETETFSRCRKDFHGSGYFVRTLSCGKPSNSDTYWSPCRSDADKLLLASKLSCAQLVFQDEGSSIGVLFKSIYDTDFLIDDKILDVFVSKY